MEKIKFGIQLTILMLSFPVLFITEMKMAGRDMEKSKQEKQKLIEVNKPESSVMLKRLTPHSSLTMMPGFNLMPVNI